MKNTIFLLAVLWLPFSTALAGVEKGEVSVSLTRGLLRPGHQSVTQLYLSAQGTTLYCRTDDVPKHRIEVRKMKSIDAPFRNRKILPDCEESIEWGNVKACFSRELIPFWNDLIRWCTN
jgi:hypothetical protein